MKEIQQKEQIFFNHEYSEHKRINVDNIYYIVTQSNLEYYKNYILSDCANKKVLEYGCGMDSYAFLLAENKAIVTGIDISNTAIEYLHDKVNKEKVQNIEFRVMDAEELDFPNKTFDLICGKSILHHLNIEKSIMEISRVLKLDGIAIFSEPLGYNPFINLFRKLTPGIRTQDEHPLLMDDIKKLNDSFLHVELKYFYLLTLVIIPFRKIYGFKYILTFFEKLDQLLFTLLPFSRKYAWIIVIKLSQPLYK